MYWQELFSKITHKGDTHGEGTESFSQDSKTPLLPAYLGTYIKQCQFSRGNLSQPKKQPSRATSSRCFGEIGQHASRPKS